MSIDTKYYTVEGWMRSKLNLKGAELSVFAIIYNMTIDGKKTFYGNYAYLQEWIGCSEPTVIKALNSLVAKNLIKKEFAGSRGFIKKNEYKVNSEEIKKIIPKSICKNIN